MSETPLREVVEFIRGITFTPLDVVEPFSEDSVVCFRTKNIQKDIDLDDIIAVPSTFVKRAEQYVHEGDLLISSANSFELVGKSVYVPELNYPATAGGFIAIVRALEKVASPRYLFHWLMCPEIQHKVRYCGRKTTNISNLNVELFLDLNIPLPPIDEQRRIAAILDKVDAIRRKRQEALKLVDELVKSQFIEMFGDPVTNPMGWEKVPLERCLFRIDSGTSLTCESYARVGDTPAILKLSAISSGVYNHLENKALPDDSGFNTAIEVQAGDLLFSRKNTYELVGMSAYVRETPPRLMMPDLIFRLATKDSCSKVYLWQLINHPQSRSGIASLASGAAASMPNISKQRLMGFDIPLPPISLQNQFARFVEQADKSKFTMQRQIDEIATLSSALKQEYFA